MVEVKGQVRLGLVGLGEVGSGIARGLRKEGLDQIVAYDRYATSGPFAGLIQSKAREAGAELVDSPGDLAARSDLIVGVVPGSSSVVVAESLRPHLGPGHLYMDIASATPKVKERVRDVLAPTGALVGDGAIMSSPLEDGHRIVILASGPGAASFRDTMVPWGMRIEVVGETLGAATGIKCLRTVFMKGIEALFVECFLGCNRYGIQQEVLGSIAQWMDARPFAKTANFLVVTDAIHAKRRADETDMSVEAMREAGIDPIMTVATAERLHWVADLGLKEHFGGVVPAEYQQVIDAIEEKLRERPASGKAD